MKHLSRELKTGLFAVIVLFATIFLINYLRGEGLWSKSRNFYVYYKDIEGIKMSSGVYINGYKTGSVEDIEFDNEKKEFKLQLHVIGDFFITSDAKAVIYSSDILGGKSIKIMPGKAPDEIKSNGILKGEVEKDQIQELIGSLSGIGGNIQLLIAGLNITVARLNDVLNDENRAEVSSIIAEINATSSNLRKITADIRQKTPEIESIIENVNDLSASLKGTSVKLDTTISNISDFSAELKEIELQETIDQIKSLVEKLQNPDGSIGKLIYTDSLHNSINCLVSDLDTLVKKIEKEPKKYLKLSVF